MPTDNTTNDVDNKTRKSQHIEQKHSVVNRSLRFIKTRNKEMDNEDTSWVFDSLICFLNGPVWNAPLQSFIEEKSLIFEPNNKNDDEYRKIHDEFKNLVDLMLGSYMEDIGITPDQFETACSNGMHQKLPAKFQENLFEQIWAANDFEMFKRMMTQKNIELQLQALELIEQKYGITPQLFIPAKENNTTLKDEQEISHEKPVLTPSQILSRPTSSVKPNTSVVNHIHHVTPSEEKVLVEVIKQCESEEPTEDRDAEEISKDLSYLEEEKHILETVLQSTAEDKNTESVDSLVAPLAHTQVDDAEIRKRQAYLKAQRDKLVALKKQVRKKHLEAEIAVNKDGEKSKLRPQSARAAEAVLINGHVDVQPQTLKIRQALAERLRSEVVCHTDTK